MTIAGTRHTPALYEADNGNLDVLRSLAVVIVVVFHLQLFLSEPGSIPMHPFNLLLLGHWGVLLFFVHTSYVLMLSLQRQAARAGSQGGLFWPFVTRRAFRLLPLSVLTVIAVIAFRWPVADYPPRPMPFRTPEIVSNLFLIQNLTHRDSAVATLWSLPYEAQMYLVLPALFLMARRWRTPWAALAVWLFGAAVSTVALPLMGGFYDMPKYVPCFLAGVVGYQCLESRPRQLPHRLWPVVLAVLSVVYLAHPGIHLGWVCCLTIGWMIPRFVPWPEGAFREVVRLIARYSYGVYLAHFVCLWVAFDALARSRWVQWVVFIVLTTAIPVLAYHCVEAPMIAIGSRVAGGRRKGGA